MAEWENSIGESDEWYTPPEIFGALGIVFDLDPCSPGISHWVPAFFAFTKADDGLSREWTGRVFMNPPFGGRNGHVPWLKKFLDHGDGIAVVRSYTSAAWFHDLIPRAECLLWPRGKTRFYRPDGSQGGNPGSGVVFLGMGDASCDALLHSGLGMTWDRRPVLRAKENTKSVSR